MTYEYETHQTSGPEINDQPFFMILSRQPRDEHYKYYFMVIRDSPTYSGRGTLRDIAMGTDYYFFPEAIDMENCVTSTAFPRNMHIKSNCFLAFHFSCNTLVEGLHILSCLSLQFLLS